MGTCCSTPANTPVLSDEAQAIIETFNITANRYRTRADYPDSLDEMFIATVTAADQEAQRNGTCHLNLLFKNINPGPLGALTITEIVHKACSIQSFAMINCGLSEIGSAQIGSGLRSNKHLVSLNLSNNPLGESGIRNLLKYIESNRVLRKLFLKNTNLDEECARIIMNRVMLAPCNGLRTLDLSCNRLNDRCLEAFTETVRCQVRLLELDISGNGGLAAPLEQAQQAIPPRSDLEPEDEPSYDSTVTDRPYPGLEDCQVRIKLILERNHLISDILLSVINRATDIATVTPKHTVNGSKDVVTSTPNQPTGENDHTNMNHVAPPPPPQPASDDESFNSSILPATGPVFAHINHHYFSYGYADARGRRKKMEDVCLLLRNFRGNQGEHLFGIFDGHGGVGCAKYSCDLFPRFLRASLAEQQINVGASDGTANPGAVRPAISESNTIKTAEAYQCNLDEPGHASSHQHMRSVQQALCSAFRRVQQRLVEFHVDGGSCALVTYFTGNELHVASVGDSRALKVTGESATWLSETLTPTTPAERKRIEDHGGFVSSNGRVCGVLAVSRALGDIQYAQVISARPVVRTYLLDQEQPNSWLVIGCDGVWDVLKTDLVVHQLRYVYHPVRAAQLIRDMAYGCGSKDNISVICIRLTSVRCK